MEKQADLSERVRLVERELRQCPAALLGTVVAAVAIAVATSDARAQNQVLRARGPVIEDASRRDRLAIGSPVMESAGRQSPCTGIRISDPRGAERLGVCLSDNGRMVVGLDAPPGTGHDVNRERITLVAYEDGGAHVGFLNGNTGIPAR
jgi:hypothetical protein